MPRLSDEGIRSLINSLDRYDEQRMRDTIELARDPEAGEQLVEWLRKTMSDDEDLEWGDRLSTISIAVALAEARAPGLMAVLLDRVITTTQPQFTDELFEYMLRRMGEPMVREAMARLPLLEKPVERSELYWLMDSAHTLPLEIQREVADFCYERVRIELESPADRNGKSAWYTCCRLLITLADARVGYFIQHGLNDITRRKRREAWERLQTSFQRYLGEPMEVYKDRDPRIDWPEQMPQWAKIYAEANEESGDPELDEMLKMVNTLVPRGAPAAETTHTDVVAKPIHAEPKISRNGPCPCGSGRKYKKCCGAAA